MNRRTALNWRTALFLSVAVTAGVPPAGAAATRLSSASRGAKEKAAQKACLTGDFKTGIEILADLYVQTGDAAYIFNQGRCNEQNHRWQEALDMFREFLRKEPNAAQKIKASTNAHISQCQMLLAEQNASAEPALKDTHAPAPPVVDTPLRQPPIVAPSPASGIEMPRPAPSDGHGLRIGGAFTAAVGICAVGAGIALNIKERSLTEELNTKFSQSKESSRAAYQTWSYASYGLGAAALVTGTILYYFAWHTAEERPRDRNIALVPALRPNTIAFGLDGTF